MAKRGQFKKGGGRHGGGGSKSKALVKYRTRAITKYKTRTIVKRGRRRGRGRGESVISKVLPLAAAAVAVGYASGEGNLTSVTDTLKKIPGVKTVGVPMGIGVLALGANRFLFRNRYLKLIGVAGVIIGAAQMGAKKFDLEWLGDPDDGGPIDD